MSLTSSIRVLLLADTHLGPGQAARLLDRIPSELARADAILHAGDITHVSLLEALAASAPVHAVLGNNDVGVSLPERLVVDIGGCEVALVHDSGGAGNRAQRLRRWFPTADVVVFGHSHIPWNEVDIGPGDGRLQRHVNPGSATQRRHQPRCTVGLLMVRDGRVESITIHPV